MSTVFYEFLTLLGGRGGFTFEVTLMFENWNSLKEFDIPGFRFYTRPLTVVSWLNVNLVHEIIQSEETLSHK